MTTNHNLNTANLSNSISKAQILNTAQVSWFFAQSLAGRYQGVTRVVLISGSSVDKSTSELIQVVGRTVSHSCRSEVPVSC